LRIKCDTHGKGVIIIKYCNPREIHMPTLEQYANGSLVFGKYNASCFFHVTNINLIGSVMLSVLASNAGDWFAQESE
jgi:hypothetical protein